MLETTIVIQFNGGSGASGDYLIVAELDDILNIDDNGDQKSSFSPGDKPFIRFHSSTNIRVDSVVSTDGGVLTLGGISRSRDESWLFASRDPEKRDEVQLPVVPGGTAVTYSGRQGAYVTKAGIGGQVTIIGDVTKAPFLMNMTINYSATSYQLVPPALNLDDEETYTIYVVFYVTLME